MAFELSQPRRALQDHDKAGLIRALSARPPSESVLLGCAADVFLDQHIEFARFALPCLISHGLSPEAIPPVAPHGRFSDVLPESARKTLRLSPRGAMGSDNIGLPLASRAALVDVGLLELLLDAGADPQHGAYLGQGVHPTGAFFGSAWASGLAISGTELGDRVLEALARHDTRVWSAGSAVLSDALRALVHPGTPGANRAWTASHARQAWAVLAPRLPELTRSQWKRAWSSAVVWSMFHVQSDSQRRLLALLEALPPEPLAGLFDAAQVKGWDLRGMAQSADLADNPGPWRALEKHWHHLGCDALPQWGSVDISLPHPDGSSSVHRVPLDGLGHLLLKARWPAESVETVSPRADAWLQKLWPDADLMPSGRTLGQWWMALASASGGRHRCAPAKWMARHDRWWEPNPHTGRAPLHECVNPGVLRGQAELIARLDWHAQDHDGNEAGATVLAISSQREASAKEAERALNEDWLRASGTCVGRSASAWVAPHPKLRQAYDASCTRHGIKGARKNRAEWRLHVAAEAMSPSQVSRALLGLSPSQRQEALTLVDPLGRTPLLWWVHAPPVKNRDGSASKGWESRCQRVFGFLMAARPPVWVPGMACHPFLPFLDSRSSADFRLGRSPEALKVLSDDLGRHLGDPAFRQGVWDHLAKDWTWTHSGQNLLELWKSWPITACMAKELIASVWQQWGQQSGAEPAPLLASRLADTVKVLQLWEQAGMPVGSSDLVDAQLWEAFCNLARVHPASAEKMKEHPVLASALGAMALECSLERVPPSGPSRPRL